MTGSTISTLPRLFSNLLILLVCTAPVPCYGAALPQDEGPCLDVKRLSREAQAQYKDSHTRDVARLMEIFQSFNDNYSHVTPADQKLMVLTLRKAFDIKPFPRETGFLRTAAACLSGMGEQGFDALLYALKHKSLEVRGSTDQAAAFEHKELKKTVIEAMGFNRDPRAIKILFNLLEEDDAAIVNSTCLAISCFSTLPQKERKALVDRLIRRYGKLDELAKADKEHHEDYERLIMVETAFNRALQKLTFHTFESAPEWNAWFEENKDKEKW